MADMNCITTFEGRIVNLDYYQGFGIEDHPVVVGQHYVKARPSRNVASADTQNLHQGDLEECKAYVRDTLAPKLNLDTTDPAFIKFYGEPPKPEPKSTSKGKGRTTKKPANTEDAEDSA